MNIRCCRIPPSPSRPASAVDVADRDVDPPLPSLPRPPPEDSGPKIHTSAPPLRVRDFEDDATDEVRECAAGRPTLPPLSPSWTRCMTPRCPTESLTEPTDTPDSDPSAFAAFVTYTVGLPRHMPADAGRMIPPPPGGITRDDSTADTGRNAPRARCTSPMLTPPPLRGLTASGTTN